MTENHEKPMGERKCKFLEIKVVQGIEHKNCLSPKMIEINKSKDDKPLVCIVNNCGCTEYEN
jgi:hypothetical protein